MKWLSRISPQERLIDSGSRESRSASVIEKLGVVMLILYAGWLTGDKIYNMGHGDGIQVGYGAGMQQGFEKGRQQACMDKPI